MHTSVKVGTSNIPNAGRGLFAKQRIRKGQVIADYTLGTERLTAAQFTSRYPSKRATHVWTPDGQVFYDAIDTSRSISGLANRASRGGTNNARFNAGGK